MAPHHGATPALTYYGSPVKLEEYRVLAGVADCRRSQKWGCKGRWALGFKPRRGSHRERGPRGSEGKGRGPRGSEVNRKDHAVLKERRGPRGSEGVNREDHVVLGCFFLPHSLGSRRDFAKKKKGERTLAGGP